MSAKETLDTIEETLDVLDEMVAIPAVRKYGKIALGVATLGGIVVGAAGSYLLTKKVAVAKLEREYEHRLDKELQESMEFIVRQSGIVAPLADNTDEEIEVETQEEVVIEEDLTAVDGERVFGSQNEKPSLDELAKRNQTVAYHKILTDEGYKEDEEVLPPAEPVYEDPDISVISRDIFMENGTEWEQVTLTYFADEGVLDVAGDFVPEHTTLIGAQRPPFGEMSGDANVVYLRNRRVEKEFEIIYDQGNASDFLAGGDEELKHSIDMLAERFKSPERRR